MSLARRYSAVLGSSLSSVRRPWFRSSASSQLFLPQWLPVEPPSIAPFLCELAMHSTKLHAKPVLRLHSTVHHRCYPKTTTVEKARDSARNAKHVLPNLALKAKTQNSLSHFSTYHFKLNLHSILLRSISDAATFPQTSVYASARIQPSLPL